VLLRHLIVPLVLKFRAPNLCTVSQLELSRGSDPCPERKKLTFFSELHAKSHEDVDVDVDVLNLNPTPTRANGN
jgi:hypothetical protein